MLMFIRMLEVVSENLSKMFLKKIAFRNIGSYGNALNEIEFSSEGEVIQLKGRSGSGKSTFLNMLSLLIYGKVQGVNKSSIANRKNKNGYIAGDCYSGGTHYFIERTFSPNSLKVYQDGVDIESIGIRDAQKFIESNILTIPFNVFNSVVSLNLNTFKSFISMTPTEKKQIVDKILGLEAINIIGEAIKADLRNVSQSLNKVLSLADHLANSIATTQASIDTYKNTSKKRDEAEMERVSNELALIASQYKELDEQIKELDSKGDKVVAMMNECTATLNAERAKNNSVISKLSLYRQDKCPTCGSDFRSGDFPQILASLNEEKKTNEANMAVYLENEAKIKESYSRYQQKRAELTSKRDEIATSGKILKQQYLTLKNEGSSSIDEEALKVLESRLDADKESNVDVSVQATNIRKEMRLLGVLSEMYGEKEGSVKSLFFSSYIPYINNNINEILAKVDFPYHVSFDNSFDAIITDMGEEVPISTISAGEHKRVDVAILCVFLKLIKRSYPQLNTLYLDETLSSLDVQTSDAILAYLNELAKELNMTIVVVSHSQINSDSVARNIVITKTAGFSSITIEELSM